MMSKRRWAFVIGVIAAVLAAKVWLSSTGGVTAIAEPREIPQRVLARGVVIPTSGIAHVRARIDGIALKVHVEEGQVVRKGQVLAEIDNPILELERKRLEAEQNASTHFARQLGEGGRAAEIELAAAEEDDAKVAWRAAIDRRQRLESLIAYGGIDDQSVKDAKFAEEQAQARLSAATARKKRAASTTGRALEIRAAQERTVAAVAAHDAARTQTEWEKLVAPIDGMIIARRIDEGDTILTRTSAVEPALFEIADLRSIGLRAEVNEVDASILKTGLAIAVHDERNAVLGKGSIARVSPQIGPSVIDPSDKISNLVRTAWIDVQWELESSHVVPTIGRKLEVVIHLPTVQAASTVPRSAVTIENGHASVSIRRGLGWASQPVKLGIADGEHVEVTDLPAGTEVRVP